MNSAPKTVLCIHDLSGLGRSSLSVILPVLAAMGVQPVALPTAVLSSHTGGLGAPARMADSSYGPGALLHYKRLGVQFDYIYSGYLAGVDQAHLVEEAISTWPDAIAVVDPVLGDHGRIYSGVSPDLVGAMYNLCCRADLILPNLTEATLLLEAEQPGEEFSPAEACALAQRLTELCPATILTGAPAGRYIGCAGAQRGGQPFFVKTPRLPRSYPGTGDIFAAVTVGCLARGNVPEAAAEVAAGFVGKCIAATPEGTDPRLGVWLEQALPALLALPR